MLIEKELTKGIVKDLLWEIFKRKKVAKKMYNLKIIPNPDTDKYAEVTVSVFNNGGYCPCALEKSDDTKCPCKEFREQETEGFCECGRFKKIMERYKKNEI